MQRARYQWGFLLLFLTPLLTLFSSTNFSRGINIYGRAVGGSNILRTDGYGCGVVTTT